MHLTTLLLLLVLPATARSCALGGAPQASSQLRVKRATCTGNKTWDQLTTVRSLMRQQHIQAFIIPTSDQHLSEYTPEKDKFREWVSGFTGSAGTAVVTLTKAALWTDGRYFLQAFKQLDCNWELMRAGEAGVPTRSEWLKTELSRGQNVSADPLVIDHDEWSSYIEEFSEMGLNFLADKEDIANKAWVNNRPSFPDTTVWHLNITFTGRSTDQKIEDIKAKMVEQSTDAMVVTALDDVAWLTNLRAADISYIPVVIAYAIYIRSNDTLQVYIKNHASRVTDEAKEKLHVSGCTGQPSPCTETKIKEYNEFLEDLAKLKNLPQKTWISPLSSFGVYSTFGDENKVHLEPLPVVVMKASKNEVERENLINSNLRDSATVVEFAADLEEKVLRGDYVTEMSASEDLDNRRKKSYRGLGPSFGTISAFGANAAIIHYKATNDSDTKIVRGSKLYLLDSGGQYYDGTTDVTRTFVYGDPVDEQKDAYTRVMMGAIDLAMAIWPYGVFGEDIDPFARKYLWQDGLDYRHGTGHAIGFLLSVHENYNRIKIRAGGRCDRCIPLTEGFVLSDEPGFYKDNDFGIRLETDLLVVNATLPHSFGDKQYLKWKPLTLVPYEPKLINLDLLNKHQLDFLNAYHEEVRATTGKYLKEQGKDKALRWLNLRTEPLGQATNSDAVARGLGAGLGLLVMLGLLL